MAVTKGMWFKQVFMAATCVATIAACVPSEPPSGFVVARASDGALVVRYMGCPISDVIKTVDVKQGKTTLWAAVLTVGAGRRDVVLGNPPYGYEASSGLLGSMKLTQDVEVAITTRHRNPGSLIFRPADVQKGRAVTDSGVEDFAKTQKSLGRRGCVQIP